MSLQVTPAGNAMGDAQYPLKYGYNLDDFLIIYFRTEKIEEWFHVHPAPIREIVVNIITEK